MTDIAQRQPRKAGWKHLASGLIAAAVVVAVFGFALPKFASYAAAWSAILTMAVWQVIVLCVLAALRLFVLPWQIQAGLPGVRFLPAFEANAFSTAMSNTIPAGGALAVGVTFEILVTAGSTIAAITRMFIVTGIWNDVIKLILPVAAVVGLAVFGGIRGEIVLYAVIGLVVCALVLGLVVLILRSRGAARWVGDKAGQITSWALRLAHRPPVTGWGERLVRFDDETGELLHDRWVQLTVTTLASEISLYLLLLLSLRFVGVGHSVVSGPEVFAAYVVSRLLQVIPITPGGLGVVQLGLAGTLGAFGAPRAQVAAATLVYTALTWFPPIPVGIGAFFVWRHGRHHVREGIAAA